MQLRRAGLDPAAATNAGLRVAQQLRTFAPYARAEVVFAYRAMGNEVPTEGILRDCHEAGKRVFVPSPGEHRFVHLPVPGNPGEGAVEPRDWRGVVLVPLVAWGEGGERLGRGQGWYDRVLSRCDQVKVGLGYEFQRASVPIEPWDVRLDYVVTESRLIEFGGVLSGRRLM